MTRMCLVGEEVVPIQRLAAGALAAHGSVEAPEFLQRVSVMAHELPVRLRQALIDFKLQEREPALVISGYPVDDDRLAATPRRWVSDGEPPAAAEYEMTLVLVGTLLGDVFGWATQQGGRLVHDVVPIKGHEHAQLSSASDELIWWHTEDAFHPCAADYVGLLCLRNPNRAATTLGCLDASRLTESERAILTQPHFTIAPDDSHQRKNQADRPHDADAPRLDEAYARIDAMSQAPPKVPVLAGGPDDYYLRLDPYFMDRRGLPPPARDALARLIDVIDASIVDVVLEPGDMLFADNFRAVHGRKPFHARFDGRDRWLKRINVTRDLRKSRCARGSRESRVIVQ
jgi:Fe(II)/alpha-ketoglutarate-dependent arginine beta-hydroxylase